MKVPTSMEVNSMGTRHGERGGVTHISSAHTQQQVQSVGAAQHSGRAESKGTALPFPRGDNTLQSRYRSVRTGRMKKITEWKKTHPNTCHFSAEWEAGAGQHHHTTDPAWTQGQGSAGAASKSRKSHQEGGETVL